MNKSKSKTERHNLYNDANFEDLVRDIRAILKNAERMGVKIPGRWKYTQKAKRNHD